MFAPSRVGTPRAGESSAGTPSAYYTPPSTGVLGVTRSRTLFFLSIRDSLAPGAGQYAASAPLLAADDARGAAERAGAMYFDADGELGARGHGDAPHLALPAASAALPPVWVDVSDEVDAVLSQLIPKLNQLDSLHSKHLLPSFVDKTQEERDIEALTDGVTADFRRASKAIARLAAQTTEAMRARALSTHEQTAARNAQTALATRVQQMSSVFRRKQSIYLRRLQGMEVQDAEMRAAGDPEQSSDLLSSALAVQEDMELSRTQLETHDSAQQTLLMEEQAHDDVAALGERDREVTQIARSISELAELFQDLSALVIEQGSLVDRIDYNIDNMATSMQHSTRELDRALAYQTGSGRRTFTLLLLLSIALVVALLVIRPFFR
ncbi:t-SNARE affecting a late Golgi compartment protein 2 [Malassezia sp. CBS 17886]|nr:t-SNARE affecting a late Golgi compartment protein 2 [Malassezia sp. CBS 17886]